MSTSECVPTGSWSPGAWPDDEGCLFVLHAPAAAHQPIELCLYDEQECLLRSFPLTARQGSLCGVYVPHVRPGQLYSYRCSTRNRTLIDPYARLLNRTVKWAPALAEPGANCQDDSDAVVPKCVVTAPEPEARQVARPAIHPRQRVIYELHVKGFSMRNPAVPAELRGRYGGLAHPVSIAYLKALGITTVQLMPCMSFMSEAHLVARGLSNYWGYNPVNFFAPDWRYAIADPVQEFRDMVDALHAAGIEVLLDVVYNHTAESDAKGPLLSFKVFDRAGYYRLKADGSLENFSGCGNSFRSDSPAGLRMIMDSLRYWYGSMGVDGFRFDLASSLGRVSSHDRHAFSPESPFFTAVTQDPQLSRAVMLAEPWDLGPDGYQLGNFPADWMEVNDRFRDGMRAFWRGDDIAPGEFANLLMGSRSHFDKASRPAHASVNNVCYHDGFTLEDLVSFNERRNLANGENNRDGHSNNISTNHGVDGPTIDPQICQNRRAHKLNLLASLLLARGTPHLLGGDERSRSQLGNNNAYCQDNEVSWFDWDSTQAFLPAVQALIGFRTKVGSLGSLVLPDENWFGEAENCSLSWWTPQGEPMTARHWENATCRAFSLMIECLPLQPDGRRTRWQVLINGNTQDAVFGLTPTDPAAPWQPLLNHTESRIEEGSISLPPMSLQLLRSIGQAGH